MKVGHVLATDAVVVDIDSQGAGVQWSENSNADDWSKNLIRARRAGRFATSVYSLLGIVTPVGWLLSLGFGHRTGPHPNEATMTPCYEQEARDAIKNLGLILDDDRTDDPAPQGPLQAPRGVGRSEALLHQRAARVLVALIWRCQPLAIA
jgi:hypothetical protein